MMEEDRESQLQRKGVLKRLLPLFILWVLCVTSAVVTFTLGDGEFNRTCSNGCCFQHSLIRISFYSAVNYLKVTPFEKSIQLLLTFVSVFGSLAVGDI